MGTKLNIHARNIQQKEMKVKLAGRSYRVVIWNMRADREDRKGGYRKG
jgi:hypothetical protein